MSDWDAIWIHGNFATMAAGADGLGVVRDGALCARGGRVAWLGPARDLAPGALASATRVHDLGGRWVTPGLVDCHTHLIFAGDRAGEFRQRLHGATYEDIARRGGGIRSTVRATRAATTEELLVGARRRAAGLMAGGVTTVEVKSGYGLTPESEMKMLRVGRELGQRLPLRVVTTFLGAHALPDEFADDREAYVRLICEEMIPAVAEEGLADAVDAFCESIAFTPEECGRVLEAASAYEIPARLHADQLSDLGGAALAGGHGALSADHLEHTSADGVEAMARAGTVAVLLPGAFYFLRDTRVPPVGRLRSAGVPMAVASDLNPGSSPVRSPTLVLNLACVLFRLTPEEALAGMTRHAAAALGLQDEIGTLEVGKVADLAVWNIEDPVELAYWVGGDPCQRVYIGGVAADAAS